MTGRLWALAAVGVTLAGCSGGRSVGSNGIPITPTGTSAASAVALGPTCPKPGAPAADWPGAVPDSLPKPPGSQISATRVVGPATYISFTTPTSLRESTLYLVSALHDAGYTVARGDAEATEADAPFVSPAVVGAIRLTLTSTCVTTWTLAVEPRQSTTGAPTLIPYHPGAKASPLPFG